MVSQGIYSIVLLIFSNVFMTFAWYGHLKMKQEFSWFAALPLIGVIAFSCFHPDSAVQSCHPMYLAIHPIHDSAQS